MLTLSSRLRIVFGWIYFLLHALMMAFAGVYVFLSLTVSPSGPEAILIVLIPLLGLFVGHWIRKAKFNPWRVALMSVSIVISTALLYIVFFFSAALQSPQEKNFHKPAIPKSIQVIDAARRNDLSGVQAELKTGARIDAQDGEGNTALHIAVLNNYKALAEFFINSGADVNARNDFGQTPLHIVKDKDVAILLIARGADVNAKDAEFGMTPIFFQDVAVAELLLKAGADFEARDKKGDTPFIWYTYNNYLAGMKFLVAQGANVTAVNMEGSTALDIAERFGNQPLVEYIRSLSTQ